MNRIIQKLEERQALVRMALGGLPPPYNTYLRGFDEAVNAVREILGESECAGSLSPADKPWCDVCHTVVDNVNGKLLDHFPGEVSYVEYYSTPFQGDEASAVESEGSEFRSGEVPT